MAKIIRLTESDLQRIVRRVIKEQDTTTNLEYFGEFVNCYKKHFGMSSVDNRTIEACRTFINNPINTGVQMGSPCDKKLRAGFSGPNVDRMISDFISCFKTSTLIKTSTLKKYN